MPYKTTGSCIYGIFNVLSDCVYIGSAARSFMDRRRTHLRDLRKGTHHCTHLQRAWNKYGEPAFVFVVLEDVEDTDNLIAIEQMWIDHHRMLGVPLYNTAPRAGSGWGIRWSDDAKRAKSAQVAAWSALPERRIGLSLRARRTDEPFSLVSPDGVLYENIENLRAFSAQHNLQAGILCHVLRGTRPHHKGWTKPGFVLTKRPRRTGAETPEEIAAYIRSVAGYEVTTIVRGARPGSTSRFMGVSWVSSRQHWLVSIWYNGKVFSIGRFARDCEGDAARRYNQVARILYGDKAKLNDIDPLL